MNEAAGEGMIQMTGKTHMKWAAAAAAVTVLVGMSSYYAGWKANVEQQAVEQAAIRTVLSEHGPLMQRVNDNASLDAIQQARIANLEGSVATLVQKMDALTTLLIQQNQRDRWQGKP